MSIDRSLRTKSVLKRHRNVLTRAERIAVLEEEERWDESMGALGLPKVAHRRAKTGKKSTKTEASAQEGSAK